MDGRQKFQSRDNEFVLKLVVKNGIWLGTQPE